MRSVEFLPAQDQAAARAPAAAPYDVPPDSESPPPPPRRLWLRSLTSRLVAGAVALVVILVAAIGAATYFELKSFLLNRLDQQLSAAATQNAGFVDRCVSRLEPGPRNTINCFGYSQAPPPQPEWLFARYGATTFEPEGIHNLSALRLRPEQLDAIAHDPNAVHVIDYGSTSLRVMGRTTDQGGLVVTGLSSEDVSNTLGRLVLLEVLIGGAAVVIALAATSWGVRRGLRNLYRVTGTAQEVAAELSPEGAGLDRRVPVTEPGTEVGQLAESMNTLLAAVETQFAARLESEQRMRQFLADASHELRTPLTSIRGYAELARMQRAAGDTQHDNLDRIESEGTRMSRLVDDLLTLARGDSATARPSEPELIDLADVLDDAVAGSRAAFPDRPIELEIAPLPGVLGDRDQLLRVVRNLITNAAVHTAAGRPILVRGCTENAGAVIAIADGGPGLPPEQAARVFERFWRADKARSRASGGTGLGLSIVATIVHAHGGTVRFDSDVQTGSTVTVWLPPAVE